MSLYMLQATPDLSGLIRWSERTGLFQTRPEDDLGYPLHAVLRAAFDTLAPAPFALMRHAVRPATLLAYSAHPAQALREQAAAFAEPDATAAIGLTTLVDKQMPDQFAVGRRLGFTVRVRPVVRVDRDGDRSRARERDAFLHAVTGSAPGEGPSRGEVYCAWLTARLAEGGAQVEHLVLDSFRLTAAIRRDRGRKLRTFRGPDASCSGVLHVTDPERFSALLARGVGRHRAFGFGMLLLRPG